MPLIHSPSRELHSGLAEGIQSTTLNTVSWQSAFWALATLALNTFIQDPGNVGEYWGLSGRVLRLSPLFCLLETQRLLVIFVAGFLKEPSLQAQARLLTYHLGLHKTQGNAENADIRDNVSDRWWFRLILGLGATLQLVKLLGMRGIPWTQGFGMSYFIVYVVVELLVWSTSQVWQSSSDVEARLTTSLGDKIVRIDSFINALQWAGLGALLVLCTWVVYASIEIDTYWDGWSETGIFIASIPSAAFGPLVFPLVFASFAPICLLVVDRQQALSPVQLLRRPVSSQRQGTYMFFCIVCFIAYTKNVVNLVKRLPVKYLAWEHATGNLLGVLGSVYLLGWLLLVAPPRESSFRKLIGLTGQGTYSEARSFTFASMIIGISLFYFTVVYYPTGTMKPPWTENLG